MLEGYKKILKNPKVKQEIRDKLEHNKWLKRIKLACHF
jgi:hypothetical protein